LSFNVKCFKAIHTKLQNKTEFSYDKSQVKQKRSPVKSLDLLLSQQFILLYMVIC